MHFQYLQKNLCIFKQKDQLYSLNISEVSDSEECGYLNARKLLFQNTLPESTCPRVLNSADTTMEALSSELSIDSTHIELEKVSFSNIWNLRTIRNMLSVEDMYSRR